MADPTLDQIGQWLLDNQDKAGTPDFVNMSNAYRERSAPKASSDLPTIQEFAEQKRRTESPYSLNNRAQRVITSVIAGVPDTLIGLYNAGARLTGHPDAQASYLAPQMREHAGVQELPADAPWYDRYGEAGAAVLTGGPRALIPGAAGVAGGDVGGKVGEYLGDAETGQLLGSLVGSQVPRVTANAGRAATTTYYSDKGRPNAPQIAEASERVGVTPTPGMLGNEQVQATEASLQRRPGSAGVIDEARSQARSQMTDAVDRVVAQQGGRPSTPSGVGDQASTVARERLATLDTESGAGQQSLLNRVGPRTDVDVSNVLARMEAIRTRTDPGTYTPIDARVNTLRQMLPRDAEGNVIASSVPYERLKDWRTNLRERTQGYDPVPGRFSRQIYDETTNSMGGAAQGAGVPRSEFDLVQARTRALEQPGGLRERLDEIGTREPKAAYDYLLRGGEVNPPRLTDYVSAVGNDQRVAPIFGSHLRQIVEETLRKREGYAPGPINFAERVDNMHPTSLDIIAGGPQGAQTVRDVSTAARAYHRPTQQGGAGKMVADVAGQATDRTAAAVGGGAVAHAVGLPWWIGTPIAYTAPFAFNRARANMLMSPSARAGMLGQRTPFGPWTSIEDLRAALIGNEAATSYQR